MDPKRWPLLKKIRVVVIISLYTFAVYAGSAIYIAPVELVVQEYKTSLQTALLGLSLYVLGCEFIALDMHSDIAVILMFVSQMVQDHFSGRHLVRFHESDEIPYIPSLPPYS